MTSNLIYENKSYTIVDTIPYIDYLLVIDDVSLINEIYRIHNIASIFVMNMISGYVIKIDGTQYNFETIEELKLNEIYYNTSIKRRLISILSLLHLNTCIMAKNYSKYIGNFKIKYPN